MKKEYISPEFNAVRFNGEDIIRTSTEPTVLKSLTDNAALKVAQIEDKQIDVFGE